MYINLCSLFNDFTHILCVDHYVNLSTGMQFSITQHNEEHEVSEIKHLTDTNKNIGENNKSTPTSKHTTKQVRLTLTWAHAGNVMNLATSPRNAKLFYQMQTSRPHYTRTNFDEHIQKFTLHFTNISNQIPHKNFTNQATNFNTHYSRIPAILRCLEPLKQSDE